MSRTRSGHFYIDSSCIGCGACDHACPGKADAIFEVPGDFLGRFAIRPEDCIDCGFCVPLCPVDCIRDARAEEDVDDDNDGVADEDDANPNRPNPFDGVTSKDELGRAWGEARSALNRELKTQKQDLKSEFRDRKAELKAARSERRNEL